MSLRLCQQIVFTLVASVVPATAQNVSAAELKAAFVANFAKFTEWPPEDVNGPRARTFCIVGDRAVASALEQDLRAHPFDAASAVVFVKPDAPLPHCHLLYVGGLDHAPAMRLLETTKGVPVFTVSDLAGFAEAGGVAQLVQVNGRMRFSINASAAQRNHLALNARLLSLATLVKDVDSAR